MARAKRNKKPPTRLEALPAPAPPPPAPPAARPAASVADQAAPVSASAPPNPEGNDAVCFTAGLAGAPFGAGVIHACLAADRKPPAVVAGISMGALSAAAMQQAYKEIYAGPLPKLASTLEADRWRWFRNYLRTLSENPLKPFWDSIPDQSDFFADMIPIRDASIPDKLHLQETASRRHLYLLVRLGRWLAKSPVSIRLLATLLVNFVRCREKYPKLEKLLGLVILIRSTLSLLTRVIFHACLGAQFFPEAKFRHPPAPQAARSRWALRVPTWGLSILRWPNVAGLVAAVGLLGAVLIAVLFDAFLTRELTRAVPRETWIHVALWSLAGLLVLVRLALLTAKLRRWAMRWPIVERIVLPLFGWAIYLLSILNSFILAGALLLLGLIHLWKLHAIPIAPFQWASIGLLMFLLALFNLPLLPFALIPETRRWMIEHTFMPELRRPLFGLEIYGFLWINMLSLVAFVVLGQTYITRSASMLPWVRDEGPVWIAAWTLVWELVLLAIPLFQVLPFAAVPWLWGKLNRRGWMNTWRKGILAWPAFLLLCSGIVLGSFWLAEGSFSVFGAYLAGLLPGWWPLFRAAGILLPATWIAVAAAFFFPPFGRAISARLLHWLGLRNSFINDFHVRWKLIQLFDPKLENRTLEDTCLPLVLVAAPLQTIERRGGPLPASQLWAGRQTPLVEALRAAIAVPPLFAPVHLKNKEEIRWWLAPTRTPAGMRVSRRALDLVDGAKIRQNPIPALFSYLDQHPELAERLAQNNDERNRAIHVVYRVPIAGRSDLQGTLPEEKSNIVDVGMASLRLSARRDTQMEVLQTNFISRLESLIRPPQSPSSPAAPKKRVFPIFADEIAPQTDLDFKNPLNPSREEILTAVAAGCRCTLETLYKNVLGGPGQTGSDVPCDSLFVSISPQMRLPYLQPYPGLPEVCERCTRKLTPPAAAPSVSTARVSAEVSLGDAVAFARDFPNLTGVEPRIVFVASGGVFRGSFHIGMLAALAHCGVRPDLIVGTSVGTLMGGALAAMCSATGYADNLRRLVNAFLHVDEQVALTRTIKGAARELGLRGRDVNLTPRQVRRMILRGARSDPGFAIAGAPAALIDAISTLFMIPQNRTRAIASSFVAGYVTRATANFLRELRRETLGRLDIEQAVIGTSLLESLARDLLLDPRSQDPSIRQPYAHNGRRIAFFGTTTDLGQQRPLLLGGEGLLPGRPFDIVEAALSSSAFPAVFAPRRQCTVFPGAGRVDVRFADGGMFDNLPFFPAIEILSWAQRGYRADAGRGLAARDFLQKRYNRPDLFIAGALNVLPESGDEGRGPFDTLASITRRASSLEHNVKIRSFESACEKIHEQVERFLHSNYPPAMAASQTDLHFVDHVVDAAVLPVFPSSLRHLNGTFAFCASTGLNKERVLLSIANGCFQTLLSLAIPKQQAGASSLTTKAVRELRKLGRIPVLQRRERSDRAPAGHCPFFLTGPSGAPPASFECPFVQAARQRLANDKNDPAAREREKQNREMREVYGVCCSDRTHRKSARS